jgi:transglutaminase-like putative cysteine protease
MASWMHRTGAACALAIGLTLPAAAAAPRVATDLSARMELYSEHHVVAEDGSEVSTYRQVTRLLKADAADSVRKEDINHSASAQRLEIVEAFTRKADGRKLKVPKGNYQLRTASGSSGGAAAFSDWNETTLIFPDLQVGDASEITYRIITKQPLFPGKFSRHNEFNRSHAFDRVTVTVDAPVGMKLLHANWQMEFSEKQVGKRQVLSWTLKNPQPTISERRDYSVYELGSEPGYAVSSFESAREIAQRYVERATPKAAVTPRVQALADEITKGVDGEKERVQVLYEWVAREIGYAGNCVGIGAVVPRDLAFVVDNRMGDCKDHATLLQALLQAKGIASQQVLVNAGNLFKLPVVPVLSMVNHVINYVPSLGLFMDSTDADTPFGQLPFQVQDKPVLAAVEGVPARTPADAGRASQSMVARYEISADGSVKGTVELRAQGRFGQQLRLGFKSLNKDQLDTAIKTHFERMRLQGEGRLKSSDPQRRSDEFDYQADFTMQPVFRLGSAGAFGIGPMLFSTAPVGAYVGGVNQPLRDHAVICMSSHSEEHYEITLPENMQVLSIPEGIAFNGPLVSYESRYRRDGRVLHVSRSITDRMPANVCSPEVMGPYMEALKPVLDDLRQQVLYK